MSPKQNLSALLTNVFSGSRVRAALAEAQSGLARERRLRQAAERTSRLALKQLSEMTARYEREVEMHRESLRAVADAYARPVTGRYVFARTPEPPAQTSPDVMAGREFIQNRKQAAYHQFYEDIRNFDAQGKNGK